MEKRRSIEVAGVKHLNPIPAASRKGPFVVSGAISGADIDLATALVWGLVDEVAA